MNRVLFTLIFTLCVAIPGTSRAEFVCEIESDPPDDVREDFKEYHTCRAEGVTSRWLAKYPDEVHQLARLYQVWKKSRIYDLRGTPSAAQWSKRYPVNFESRDVSLTPAQIKTLLPPKGSNPVFVAGEFERLFVDRDNHRLFLTTREEGLVSISIAGRYSFEMEGGVGTIGGKDFVVLDAETAILEQPNPSGGNGDLVILDISDRNNPREVSRLKGVIPALSPMSYFTPASMNAPPTFEEYLAIHEGTAPGVELGVQTICPVPVLHEFPTMYCRPNGSCYVNEYRKDADEGVCTKLPLAETDGVAGDVFLNQVHVSGIQPTEDIPQGGKGGAGSLSQMLVYQKTLYVMSTRPGLDRGWLTSFDITEPRSPRVEQVIALDNGPEALQLHDNLLLIAGRDAVITASLAIAQKPRLLGEYRQDCPALYDPIVVQGSIGYRTIIVTDPRSSCTSRLEVIDLSRPHQPKLLTTRPAITPRGLAVLGDHLFVADQNSGIKIFDINNPINPSEIWTLPMFGVKDLVLSDFDLYAMSDNEIRTFFVGPLYKKDARKDAAQKITGPATVKKR